MPYSLNMRFAIIILCIAISSITFTSCATTENDFQALSLTEIASKPGVVTIPYETNEDGLLLVPVSINGESPRRFALDTGATRSVTFQNINYISGTDDQAERSIRIHGMVNSKDQPLITVASLQIGDLVIENAQIAALDERFSSNKIGLVAQGLIGLDVLSNFRMFVDAERKLISLIPQGFDMVDKPSGWKFIRLESNPYIDDGRSLKFLTMRIQGRLSPALLDTGSAVNLMNWEIARDPQLRSFRRRLKKDWELQGAVGSFNPSVSVKVVNFRSSEKFWKQRHFIVKDIKSLDVLGIAGKPFIIAGINIFADRSFYIDFLNNIVYLEEDPADKFVSDNDAVTGSLIKRPDGGGSTSAPVIRKQ